MSLLYLPKPLIMLTYRTEVTLKGSATATTLKTIESCKSAPKIIVESVSEKTKIKKPKTVAKPRKVNKTVVIIFVSSLSFSSFSPTYFTIPEGNAKVETPSNELMKFRKFPTYAIPPAPTNTASILDVITPIPIFSKTLKLFKDEILNNCVCSIFLIKFKSVLINNPNYFINFFISHYRTHWQTQNFLTHLFCNRKRKMI